MEIQSLVDIGPDAPPQRSGTDKPPKDRPRVSPGRPRKPPLEDRLEEAFGLIGIGIVAANEYDGTVFLQGAPKLAKSLADLAAVNESVRKVLEAALTGGMYGALAMAVAGITLPIMANHGMLPEPTTELVCGMFNVEVPPHAKGNESEPGNNGGKSAGDSVARIHPAS